MTATNRDPSSADRTQRERKVGSLSVVIPAYNSGDWIPRTVERIDDALQATVWEGCQIVVVDDGSDDGSGEVIDRLAAERPGLEPVHTANQGRFLARRTGIDAATGDFVLLVDSRVFLMPDSLRYLSAQLEEAPERSIWNGHVEIDLRRNPYARFWRAVTFVAWRRYLRDPRPVTFGADDFDYYPKGTGCFFSPRGLLLEAYEAFSSHYDDLRHVNDDTSLIRHLAERQPIHLAPGFGCTYYARETLRTFLRHAFHRGIHFVDGYLRPGTRYFLALITFLVATPIGLALLSTHPELAAGGVLLAVAVAFVAALVLGVRPATAASFALLSAPFASVYGAGIWTGVVLAITSKLRGRS